MIRHSRVPVVAVLMKCVKSERVHLNTNAGVYFVQISTVFISILIKALIICRVIITFCIVKVLKHIREESSLLSDPISVALFTDESLSVKTFFFTKLIQLYIKAFSLCN